jgi:gluconokinase
MLSYENRATMGQATSEHLSNPTSLATPNTITNGTSPSSTQLDTKHHIWLITGPAGCGKSTVAQFIAKTMDLPFIEGDEVYTKCSQLDIES